MNRIRCSDKRFKGQSCLILLLMLSCSCFANPVEEVVLWYRNFDAPHTRNLLELALEKTTAEYGPYVIQRGAEINQQRALASLVQNQRQLLEVMNVVIDDDREQSLIPIRVVSDEGLIGHRVCIVNKDDLPRFEGVRSHKDIMNRGIVFGQGAHWPDTDVLTENALEVMTSINYEDLFEMLIAKRFHCFLRGANEAVNDLKQHQDQRLMIEPNLLFSYPSTSTFFVNKENPRLAARIELGLRRAKLDGSFARYFEQTHAETLDTLNLNQRRVIRLNNPYISNEFLEKSTRQNMLRGTAY